MGIHLKFRRLIKRFKFTISERLKCKADRVDLVCPICLEKLGRNYVQLACGHIFNRDCLGKWTTVSLDQSNNASCPMCREVYDENKWENDSLGM